MHARAGPGMSRHAGQHLHRRHVPPPAGGAAATPARYCPSARLHLIQPELAQGETSTVGAPTGSGLQQGSANDGV